MVTRRLHESHPIKSNVCSDRQPYSLPSAWTVVHNFHFGYKAIDAPATSWLTVNGSDVNGLGRIVLIGGLLLLPVSFVINLLPTLKREGLEGKRKLYPANVIVGIIILVLITVTWGGLILEGIYCLQGIRCD